MCWSGPMSSANRRLFAALKLLFAEAYTANNKVVRRLQPNGGGAPFVECDFVADGRQWRLSKQFLAGRVAELRERSGSTIYRGGDVEPALTELLEKVLGARSNLDLLWVAQGQSFEQPKPDGAVRQTLESLTRSEAEAAAGGGEIAGVHGRVSEQLFKLVTERARRPKAGGAYLRALEHRNELDQRWHAAHEKLEASQQRRDKLAEIEQQIEKIEEAARAGDEARRIEALRKELEDGGKAMAQLELCQERVDRLEAEHGDATGQLERFDSNVAAEAALAKQLQEIAQRLAELTEERSAAERRRERGPLSERARRPHEPASTGRALEQPREPAHGRLQAGSAAGAAGTSRPRSPRTAAASARRTRGRPPSARDRDVLRAGRPDLDRPRTRPRAPGRRLLRRHHGTDRSRRPAPHPRRSPDPRRDGPAHRGHGRRVPPERSPPADPRRSHEGRRHRRRRRRAAGRTRGRTPADRRRARNRPREGRQPALPPRTRSRRRLADRPPPACAPATSRRAAWIPSAPSTSSWPRRVRRRRTSPSCSTTTSCSAER